MPFLEDDQASVLEYQSSESYDNDDHANVLTIAALQAKVRSGTAQGILELIMQKVNRLSSELQQQIILPAVQRLGTSIQHASDDMKNNKVVVVAAVTQTWRALQYCSVEMKGDRELCTAAVAQNWRALEWASEEMKGDRELCTAAVAQNGMLLKDLPKEMKGDRELCMAAVAQIGLAL